MARQLLTERRLLIGELALAAHLLFFALLPPYSTVLNLLVNGLFGSFVSPNVSYSIVLFITFFCVPLTLGITALLEPRKTNTSQLDAVVRIGALLTVLVVSVSVISVAYLQFQVGEALIVGFVPFVPYVVGLVFALIIVVRYAKEDFTAVSDTG